MFEKTIEGIKMSPIVLVITLIGLTAIIIGIVKKIINAHKKKD